MRNLLAIVMLAGLFFFVVSCTDEEKDNPFNNPNLQEPVDSVDTDTLTPGSFAFLHYKVFRPTCANSGCHDGTFEPDFRTIESSYNTMVYQPVIKNDVSNSFEYRVKPGSSSESVLMNRLTVDIDGQSGIMPLSIDPGSDWPAQENSYENYIRDWINNGALDQFGNPPTQGNREPQMLGVVAFADGSSTALPRGAGNGPIEVPSNTQSLQIWIAFADDQTPVGQLGVNEIRFSNGINDFTGSMSEALSVVGQPITAEGYFGDPVSYFHRITIDPSQYANLGQFSYFRTTIQDADNDPSEIPNQGSFQYIKEYFAFTVIP